MQMFDYEKPFREAVGKAYQVFSGIELPPDEELNGYYGFISLERDRMGPQVYSTPVRLLTEEQLAELDFFPDVRLLKYFLPPILENLPEHRKGLYSDSHHIVWQLMDMKWREWSQDEICVIEHYFSVVFEYALMLPTPFNTATDYLKSIHTLGLDLIVHLKFWKGAVQKYPSAFNHLIDMIVCDLGSPHLNDENDTFSTRYEKVELASDMEDQSEYEEVVLKWLMDPELEAILRTTHEKNPDWWREDEIQEYSSDAAPWALEKLSLTRQEWMNKNRS